MVSVATVSFATVATVPFAALKFPLLAVSFATVSFAAVSFVALQFPSSTSAKGLSLASAVAVTVCAVASLVYCGAVCSSVAMLATTVSCLVQLWYASLCAASFDASSGAASWSAAFFASVFALLWGAASVAASWCAASFDASSVAASWCVATLTTVLWSAAVLAAQWLADSLVALYMWSAALYAVPSSEMCGLRRHWSSLLSSSSGSSYLFTDVFVFWFWGSVCGC